MILSTSPSDGEDVDGAADLPTAGRADSAAGSDHRRRQAEENGRKTGHVILAPRTGSGVGIGPGFTAHDLAGEAGGDVPKCLRGFLCCTNLVYRACLRQPLLRTATRLQRASWGHGLLPAARCFRNATFGGVFKIFLPLC